jgi:hypothetical protein
MTTPLDQQTMLAFGFSAALTGHAATIGYRLTRANNR